MPEQHNGDEDGKSNEDASLGSSADALAAMAHEPHGRFVARQAGGSATHSAQWPRDLGKHHRAFVGLKPAMASKADAMALRIRETFNWHDRSPMVRFTPIGTAPPWGKIVTGVSLLTSACHGNRISTLPAASERSARLADCARPHYHLLRSGTEFPVEMHAMNAVKKFGAFLLPVLAGCDASIFPIWEPNVFDKPPAALGPLATREYRVEVPEGADGEPLGITIFTPVEAEGPLPAFVWVMGSNVQPYYHQSLHETLASWGYAVIVPETRLLMLTDLTYHRRNMDLVKQAIQLALDGELDVAIDEQRIAAGGYSIGATMAAFVAAEEQRVDALVFWAPTGSPFWTGVDPDVLLPQVTQPAYYLLGEFDTLALPDGFPAELQRKMPDSKAEVYVIPEGLHLYFQQPTGADTPSDPESGLTRFEQQGIAIERTRAWLDATLYIERM
jgi:dienelactone hydrolase